MSGGPRDPLGASAGHEGSDVPIDIAALYDALAPRLYRYALMMLADPAGAEDAIHQVFARMVAFGGTLAHVRSAPDYLRQAVRNECLTLLRQRSKHVSADEVEGLLEPCAPDARDDERLMMEQSLGGLPAEQREVIHLKVYEGLTFDEIAGITGVSPNTAASRYRYAMAKLRARLASGSA